MKTLSERLKAKRFELGLTQARLAELSGTKQQTIQQIESGVTTRPRRLIELADVLNCEPAWLLHGDSKVQPDHPKTIIPEAHRQTERQR